MAKGKSAYWLTQDGQTLLEGWARNGLSQRQIAHNMGIGYTTLKEWLHRYPAIAAPLKDRAKSLADLEVENALRKRALGCVVRETIYERQRNKETGEYEMVVVRIVEKEIAPDITAAIFWLKNREPGDWREKRETPLSPEDIPDDGFIKALGAEAVEVMADGGDIPQNISD